MIDFTTENRIKGWNSPTKEDLKKLSIITMENQFDEYNRPNWIWPDYPEGKPIYSPQPYTPEQLETSRKDTCREEIRKLYSIEDELKILRKAVQSTEPDYVKYNLAVENIITTSKEYKLIPEEKAPKEIINDPIKTS